MFPLRVLLRSPIQYFLKQRPNAKVFLSNVFVPKSQFIYPNNNEKLGKYLDHLYERTDEGNLSEIRRKYAVRKSIVQEILDLEIEMREESNEEILVLAVDERRSFMERLSQIDKELMNQVLVLNSDESPSAMVIEVRAGVGGKEATLFTGELHSMYVNYLEYKSFEYNLLDEDVSAEGGLAHASIMVRSTDAFSMLLHEAGVHRVQRIPKTERLGRIHTSTAIVAVVPCPNELEINLNSKDLRIDTMRASGPGGQNVNKLDSAVRIVHIPTGISVECQEERTQVKNKKIAMQKLYSKLYQIELRRQRSSIDSTRKSQIGSGAGLRAEKIRTYNYSQHRVTDHRLEGGDGTMHDLNRFLNGGEPLDNMIKKVRAKHNSMRLAEIVRNFE